MHKTREQDQNRTSVHLPSVKTLSQNMVLWQGAAASRFAVALVELVQLESAILTLSVMKISV